MKQITYTPIGICRSPWKSQESTPIQPAAAKDTAGTLEIYEQYRGGLADLDGFSHIIVLFHLHKSAPYRLKVVPYLDTEERGVFSTRAPSRPNSIGLSTVRIISVEGNIIHITGVDMLDGSPVLDIKPYIPKLDSIKTEKTGWLSRREKGFEHSKADRRFSHEKK